MKYTVALIMAVAAIGSSAQSLSDLPECGQGCIQRMLGAAQGLGCNADDVACLCKNPDFTYGIRDCSVEACTADADAIINYGAEYCKANGGVVITTSGSAVTPIPTSTDGSDGGAGGAAGKTQSDDGDVAIATSTFETVVEESGSSVTKTTSETYYSSPTDGASSSGDSGSETTQGDATNTESGAPTSTDGSGSGNGDGNNDGNGGDGNDAVNAAAPIGLLAAAGIMAMLV